VYRTIAFEHVRERGPPTAASPGLWSVPNLLTYLRLLLVPVVAWGGLSTHPHAPLLTAVLFVVASLTDWLDGYLARRVSAHGGTAVTRRTFLLVCGTSKQTCNQVSRVPACPRCPAAPPKCPPLPPQWEIATAFGAFLDPVADKVMCAALAMAVSCSVALSVLHLEEYRPHL
jgi:CDP-alcohol phosphatidyltransferase